MQEPDVVALQEVDVGRSRSKRSDQARAIAAHLGMHVEFLSAHRCDEGHYGNAVLSRYPIEREREACLPQLHKQHEPRALQWVRVHMPRLPLNVLNTHLSLNPRERLLQVETILAPDWLDAACAEGATVLCGDFNAGPRSVAYQKLAARIGHVQHTQKTFPSLLPLLRLDHVFVSAALRVERCRVVKGWLARLASDHLPIIIDVQGEEGLP